VKAARRGEDCFEFQLANRERDLLVELLVLYPRIPPAYQPLSKVADLEGSNQRLLDEALAEEREENRKHAQALLADPKRLTKNQAGWCLALTTAELEQLLQILNDIRVGSWISLGSPQSRLEVLDETMAPDFWAMEMAGFFQMRFLEVLEGE
jgi:hypothetical protein